MAFLAWRPASCEQHPCEDSAPEKKQAAARKTQPISNPAAPEQTVLAAGDIVDCSNLPGFEAAAELIDAIPGTAQALGDLAYPNGTKAISAVMRKDSEAG